MQTITFHPDTDSNESIKFDLSKYGSIDSQKYSLRDSLYDARLQQLKLEQRFEIMNSYLTDLKAQDLYSYKREMLSGCDAIMESAEHTYMINLASNDYLNLSQHPRVKNAAKEALENYGLGTGSVAMLAGYHSLHRKLESALSRFKGVEEVMIFSSGYGTNIGVLRALLGSDDAAICDMYAHASLMDGCSHTNRLFFKHNDMTSLELTLQKAKSYINKIVIIDGVYSMDGDIARLDEIIDVAHKYGAWVLLDDAHGTGVIGMNGRGTADYHDLKGKVDIITGTFSKALGAVGGFVGGSKEVIQYLQIACRSYMFSTSPALPVVAGVLEALAVLDEEPNIIQQLHRNIHYFKTKIVDLGFNVGETQTAIIPLIIGDDTKVKKMARKLHKAGILVNAVPYPAVPKKLTRVRISLSSNLTKEQMDYAIHQIEAIGIELNIISKKKQLELA